MINNFFGINTTLQGLMVQQAEQNVLADNISKAGSYVDANGYVMTTEQQLNITQGSPYLLPNGSGVLAIGTGPLIQSITRMRSSFLDAQIQQQSQIVGEQNVLYSTLNQIQSIIDSGTTNTLNYAIDQLGTAFSTLATATAVYNNLSTANATLAADIAAGAPPAVIAADNAAVTAAQAAVNAAQPTIAADSQTAVNAGVAFAQMANSQYTQLQNLQTGMNGQLQQDVASANNLLQQIAQVNKALVNSQGADVNDLLDARDYDITLLSRLMNVNVNYSSDGTASVYLGGIALVDASGAAILGTNAIDPNNSQLFDVTLQSPQGGSTQQDITSMITAGTIGGDIQARDVVIQSYIEQVNQIAFSVSQLANTIYSSGYTPGSASAAANTGINFFVGGAVQNPPNNPNIPQTTNPPNTPVVNNSLQLGADAQDINVNATLVANAGNLGFSSGYGPLYTNNEIAVALGMLPKLLANNFAASNFPIGTNVDPGAVLSANGSLNPITGAGTISINSNSPVSYNPATDTIYSVLTGINANDNNVAALFNYNAQQVLIFSTAPINLTDSNGATGFTQGVQLNEMLASSIRMNNSFSPTGPQISGNTLMDSTANTLAFEVTPSSTGSFTINGSVPIYFRNINPALVPSSELAWSSTLQGIENAIGAASPSLGATFFGPSQQFYVTLDPNTALGNAVFTPIQVSDITGNFSVFTGLNSNISADSLASNLTTQVNTSYQNAATLKNQANDALTQLNNAQANIGTLSTPTSSGASGPGTPVAVAEEQAMQDLVAYNASLEMLQIQNQMFADLLNIISETPQPAPVTQVL
jgi:flagellar hook-associated protein FlgK